MRWILPLLLLLTLVSCSDKTEDKSSQSAQGQARPSAATPQAKDAAGTPGSSTRQFALTPPAQIASASLETGGRCSVDSINGQPDANKAWTFRKGADLTISGWVLDSAAKTTSDWAVLRLDSADGATHHYVVTNWRGERPDLTQAFGAGPGLGKATFTVAASSESVPAGSYTIVVVHRPASSAQACSTGKTVTLTQ